MLADLPRLLPDAARAPPGIAPAVAAKLEAALPTGTIESVAAGRTAMRRIRAFTDRFFGTYLRRESHPR